MAGGDFLAVFALAIEETGVSRLDGFREHDVGECVFVAAIDLRFPGQRGQFGERSVHLGRRSFE